MILSEAETEKEGKKQNSETKTNKRSNKKKGGRQRAYPTNPQLILNISTQLGCFSWGSVILSSYTPPHVRVTHGIHSTTTTTTCDASECVSWCLISSLPLEPVIIFLITLYWSECRREGEREKKEKFYLVTCIQDYIITHKCCSLWQRKKVQKGNIFPVVQPTPNSPFNIFVLFLFVF